MGFTGERIFEAAGQSKLKYEEGRDEDGDIAKMPHAADGKVCLLMIFCFVEKMNCLNGYLDMCTVTYFCGGFFYMLSKPPYDGVEQRLNGRGFRYCLAPFVLSEIKRVMKSICIFNSLSIFLLLIFHVLQLLAYPSMNNYAKVHN